MKVGKLSDDRVIVTIKESVRDSKTQKIVYQTFKSFDVRDATPEDVYKVIFEAINQQ